MQLQNNTALITDPQLISEKFNSYFIDTVNDLLNKNSSCKSKQTSQYNIETCPWSTFVPPVTEDEVENVINKLKGKFLAGFDEIPEGLVKHYSHYIAKPLTHVFNLSFKFGIYLFICILEIITNDIGHVLYCILRTLKYFPRFDEEGKN
jgi:hypothetical protein